jgi:hypothetical protein
MATRLVHLFSTRSVADLCSFGASNELNRTLDARRW